LIICSGTNLQNYLDEVNDDTYRGHKMSNVVDDWMGANNSSVKDVINCIIDHIDRRLRSLETAPELAALRVITTPVEWPVAAADLATYGEHEVRKMKHALILE
jgi:hypothetical protein